MRRSCIAVLIGLLMAPLLVPGSAGAQAQTFVASGDGEAADVTFQSVDETGCIETFVSLIGVDERVKESGVPSERRSWAGVTLSRYDGCNAIPLISAIGATDLGPSAFQMDKLDSAVLSATVEMQDFVSGTWFPVDISMAWEASVEPVRKAEHLQIWERGLVMNVRVDGTSRTGIASGTVTDGSTNFTPGTGTALLSSGHSLEVSIGRN